jgi:hypothetical protein
MILSPIAMKTEKICRLFDEINIEQLLYTWLRNGRIFGTSYLEWTGDNLSR